MGDGLQEFKIPSRIFDELYEVSGGASAYKGFIVAIANEDGIPVIICKTDTPMTKGGLYSALEKHLEAIMVENFDAPE